MKAVGMLGGDKRSESCGKVGGGDKRSESCGKAGAAEG